jgi:ABC-type branched-subunit amino acid transport system substrate-binding protein
MRKTRALKLVTLFALISLLSVYGGTAGGSPTKPPDRGNVNGTLEFGQLAPQTGQLSNIVQSLTTPVTMAVDEINAAGGVLDKPVTYTQADDGTDPTVASQSLDRLLNSDKVDTIMGPASSTTMLGILDKVRSAGVLTCSGSTTSAELTKAKSDGYFFRTAPPDRLQGPALSELVLKDGHSKVGILVRNDSYGVGFGKALKKALTAGGAKVVADVAYDADATNFDADVQKVADKKPDAIIVIGFNDDGAKIVTTMIGKNLGPSQIPIYTADGMQSSKFGTTVDASNPAVVGGIKGTAPAAQPAGVQSPFLAKFAATGVDPIFSGYYYDCTILTALAAEKAKSDDAAKMKKAFASNVKGKERCNTYADCKQLLDAGMTIRFEGASQVFRNLNKFGTFEPSAGIYEVWSYDTSAKIVTEPPASQIRIGGVKG